MREQPGIKGAVRNWRGVTLNGVAKRGTSSQVGVQCRPPQPKMAIQQNWILIQLRKMLGFHGLPSKQLNQLDGVIPISSRWHSGKLRAMSNDSAKSTQLRLHWKKGNRRTLLALGPCQCNPSYGISCATPTFAPHLRGFFIAARKVVY